MADLVNPYANPYLPSFVNQRPRINDVKAAAPAINFAPQAYSQIHPVNGFEGARAYNLANGASEILVESDPNLSRIYVVAKDANGQSFVQGFDLIPVEEPKPVTMDDLSSTMNRILERLDKLEGDRANEQPNHGNAWKSSKQPGNAGSQPVIRSNGNGSESAGGNRTNDGK